MGRARDIVRELNILRSRRSRRNVRRDYLRRERSKGHTPTEMATIDGEIALLGGDIERLSAQICALECELDLL